MIPGLPNPWLIVAGMVAILGAFAFGVYGGHHYAWLQEQAEVAKAETKIVAEVQHQDTATQQIAEKAEEKQIEIRTVYRTIVKEVKVYVTQQDDDRCTVNAGFVRLWNAAATGKPPVPAAAGEPDERAPSGVELSDIADAHGGDGETYQAVAQQLRDLQAWVRQMQAEWGEK